MLRLRLVYGLALALGAALTMVGAVLFHTSVWQGMTWDEFVEVGIRQKPWLVAPVLVGSFLTGIVFWQPRRSPELAIDMVRSAGVMVGMSFWVSGLVAGCVWAFAPGHEIDTVHRFIVGPLYASFLGGPFGAGFAGPIAYPVCAALLLPLRRLEPVIAVDAWCPVAGAVIGILSLCSAAITVLASLMWIAVLGIEFYGLIT